MEDAKTFFAEVRKIQEETALQMKETERTIDKMGHKIDELSEIQKTASRTVDKMGHRIDEFGKKVDKFSDKVDKLGDKVNELSEIQKITSRTVDKMGLKVDELSEIQKTASRTVDKMGLKVDKLSDFYEGTSRNLGYAAETYFQDSLAKTLRFGGVQYDDIMRNPKKEGRRGTCEFDIVLINHIAAALIEVKQRVHPDFVRDVAEKKSAEFRKFFPEFNDKSLYLGVAGMSMDDTVIKEAKKYGIGVLKQNGDAIETLNMPLIAY